MTTKDQKDVEINNEDTIPPDISKDNDNIEGLDNLLHEEKLNEKLPEGTSEEKENEEKENEEKLSTEENLQNEIYQLRDEKLRLLAEMDNVRKRADKERIDSIRYGGINLARDILSPDDNLTRALEAIPREEKNSENIKNLIDGLKMVQKEFSSILEKHGIKKINAINTKFDHNFHQAMVEIENDEVDHGTVIQEMQSGYTMHDRLLRPSMVGVSKKKQKKENDEN